MQKTRQPTRKVVVCRGRGGHRGDRREVLAGSVGGALRRAGPQIVVSQEQRRIPEILHLASGVTPFASPDVAFVAWTAKRKGCLSTGETVTPIAN